MGIRDSRKGIKLYIVAASIIMLLISGLRHEGVGNDTYAIMIRFEEASSMSWQDATKDFVKMYMHPDTSRGKDPGEYVFYKILSYVVQDSRTFLFVLAGILLSSLGYFIYKNSQNIQTVFFSYLFYVNMFYGYLPNSASRQTLSLSLLFMAYLFLNNRKQWHFLILVLIASVFHKSILIALLVLPLFYLKNIKLIYRISLLLFGIMLVFYQGIGTYLGSFNDIYEGYASINYFASTERPILAIFFILGLYIIGFVGLYQDKLPQNFKLAYIGTALTLVFIPLLWFDPSSIRIVAYFGPWLGILIPHSIRVMPKLQQQIFIAVCVLLFFKAFTTNDNYHFYWEQMQLHERYYSFVPTRQNTETNLVREVVADTYYLQA